MKNFLQKFRRTFIVIACLLAIQGRAQTITTIVGNGTYGSSGDGGPATAAELDLAQGVVRFYAGNLYLTDQANQRIRKVNPFTGIITSIIGNDTAGYRGDGGPATNAEINNASFFDFDTAGNMYFSDMYNNVIRKVSASGIISTFAGSYPYAGYNGDNIAATAAYLNLPSGLVVDRATGNVYFCDDLNSRIRMVDGGGIIHTIAGNDTASFRGDGGAATAAEIDNPVGLCMDGSGNLYFSDAANYRIRKITPSGIITTFAGSGYPGTYGDGGPATAANMWFVEGLAYDAANNQILLAQSGNNIIRAVNLSGSNIITTVAGVDTPGYSGDGGAATAAKLNEPYGIDVDCAGNYYISDYSNARIRFVNNHYNHRPTFANGGTTGFSACSSTATSINSLLGISDTDAGQTEWWVAYGAPAHGTLAGFDAQGTAMGALSVVTPTGLTYTSASGFVGVDHFVIGIADCAGGTALIGVSVTVNPIPAAISGTGAVCAGNTVTLSDATGGGTWSVTPLGTATIGSATGVVTGVATGHATVVYTAAGCTATAIVTVNPLPTAISGATTLCTGSSATLSDGLHGGSWSSSNAAIASINAASGLMTGNGGGTCTITYALPTGCYITTGVTVNPAVMPISGTMSLCSGGTTTLTDGSSGGTWSSSNAAVASIGSISGVVTGGSSGVALVSYTVSSGCYATALVTVNPLPGSISGTMDICVGFSTPLSDGSGGGTWSSASTGIAAINSTSGVLMGISGGTSVISYTFPTGCSTTAIATVNTLPAAITGNVPVCTGATSTLSDATGGGTWTSSSTGIATVSSSTGVVNGIATGTATISYTLGTLGAGCYVTTIATVNATPSVITGTTVVCVGNTTTLSDPTTGGSWSSSSSTTASVTSGGVMSGIGAGTATVTYTASNGCYVTTTVTVQTSSAITGTGVMCVGNNTTLSNPVSGGTWTSSNSTVASINTSGVVTGNSAGTATITYTLSGGCYVIATVTVNAPPAAITGQAFTCASGTVTLTDATTGGTWSSSNTGVATIGASTGTITGVSTGTTVITYSAGGCYTITSFTVNAAPTAISGGASQVCDGATTTFTDATTGGTWSSSNTSIASIGATSGILTGGPGSAVITVTYSTGTGCTATTAVSVNPNPNIYGVAAICLSAVDSFYSYTPGGAWSSSNTGVAPVSATGIVSGASGGTATITYTMPATGCYATTLVSVLVVPVPTGLHNLCAWGDTMTISEPDTSGRFGSTLVTAGATRNGASLVMAAAPGTATIDYTLVPWGCLVSTTITVNPLPGPITGAMWACGGLTDTLNDTAGPGYWTSANTAIATVGYTSGIVTGVASGTDYITYTIAATGCHVDTPVVIDPLPAAIAGNSFICATSTITLTDATGGGTWSSSAPSVATVNSTSGVVTGVATGTTTITYTLCGGIATTVVSVTAVPAIVGPDTLCPGATATLSDPMPGGTWSSNSYYTIPVTSGGVIYATSTGAATIAYNITSSCAAYLTVYALTGAAACTPCAAVSSYGSLGTSGYITANVPAGNYSINNNVTVRGNITFDNAIIMMGAGDTIFIDTSSTLTVDSSHIFSLCNMWQGMDMMAGHNHSAHLFVKEHSLIEDAECAVYIPYATPPSSGYIFESQASVFNRNRVGIDIEHYNDVAQQYPFMVHNTVITSRDLSSYSGYPTQWPATTDLKARFFVDTFTAPFNIMNYTAANCPNGTQPLYGIQLDSVANYYSATPPVGVPIPSQYDEVTIGDLTTTTGNSNQNLIDFMNCGVYAINSNVTCVNDAFTNMQPNTSPLVYMYGGTVIYGGSGVYAAVTNDFVNVNRVRVYTPATGPYQNLFYGFNYAVETHNYLQTIVQDNWMINKVFNVGRPPVTSFPMGTGGVLVKTAKYDTIDISYNTISNVMTGASISMTYDPTVWATVYGHSGGLGYIYHVATPSQFINMCNISNNTFQAQPDWSASLTFQQMKTAFSYQNPLIYHPPTTPVTYGTTVIYGQNLSITNNTAHDVYNGMYVNNYDAATYIASTSNNTIYLRENATGSRVALGYGINNTLCNNAAVAYNTVTSGVLNDSMRAYYFAMNTGQGVGCNLESTIGRGYEFFLTNLGTEWHDNDMANNYKGFVLNGAVIGAQTRGGYGAYVSPIDDEWSTGSGWSAANFQTFVIQADPSHSALYTATGALYTPTFNGSIPLYLAYGVVPGSLMPGGGPTVACPIIHSGPDGLSLNDAVAQMQVNYVYNVISANWNAQYALWKAALMDSAIIDSSAVVAEFATLAGGVSRYKYLTDIETALNIGDLTAANTLLAQPIDAMIDTANDTITGVQMADGPAADFIVQNYQQFYGLYIKYETNTFSEEDSTNLFALTQLCPEINGGVVYQARALFNGIYNDYTVYNDDSCISTDSTYVAERHTPTIKPAPVTAQQYILWPNPNNGNLSLGQKITDNDPVHAEIWNELGETVYKDNLLFSGGSDQMHIVNAAPGLYLLRLTDSKDRQFVIKFVIQ